MVGSLRHRGGEGKGERKGRRMKKGLVKEGKEEDRKGKGGEGRREGQYIEEEKERDKKMKIRGRRREESLRK